MPTAASAAASPPNTVRRAAATRCAVQRAVFLLSQSADVVHRQRRVERLHLTPYSSQYRGLLRRGADVQRQIGHKTLAQRQIHRRTRVGQQASFLEIAHHADNLTLAGALADGVLIGPISARRRLVDDRHARSAWSVLRRELASRTTAPPTCTEYAGPIALRLKASRSPGRD